MKLATSINLEDPRSFLGRELPGFAQFDTEILLAGQGTDYTNMPAESPPPSKVMEEEREANLAEIEKQQTQSDNAQKIRRNKQRVIKGCLYLSHAHYGIISPAIKRRDRS